MGSHEMRWGERGFRIERLSLRPMQKRGGGGGTVGCELYLIAFCLCFLLLEANVCVHMQLLGRFFRGLLLERPARSMSAKPQCCGCMYMCTGNGVVCEWVRALAISAADKRKRGVNWWLSGRDTLTCSLIFAPPLLFQAACVCRLMLDCFRPERSEFYCNAPCKIESVSNFYGKRNWRDRLQGLCMKKRRVWWKNIGYESVIAI
jgi:hypothetical protein